MLIFTVWTLSTLGLSFTIWTLGTVKVNLYCLDFGYIKGQALSFDSVEPEGYTFIDVRYTKGKAVELDF